MTFSCQLAYTLPEGAQAQINSDHLKQAVSVVFEPETETVTAVGILKDTGGQAGKFTLVAQRNCRLDAEKTTELDVIVEAPKIRFDQNVPEQPEGIYPGEAAEFEAKAAVFRCKLN